MPLKPIADEAVDQISDAISAKLSDAELEHVLKIVEQAVIDSAVSTSQKCAGVVKVHTGNEADLAHKIAEKLKQAETALIANLMGMR